MKIRILFIELLIVIAVIGTISAGGKQEQPTDKKEAVKIAFWIPGSDKVSEDYFYQAAKDFTTRNPRIQVEVTILPPAAPDINTKLNAAKLSNTYPDVFSSFIVFIGARGTRGEFADLTPFIEKWPEKDDFYSSSFELGKYKGKIYGISYFPAPEILVYRKDFFKEAGLDPEKPPRNWDELEAYALKLAKRDANNNVVRAGLDIPAINPEVFIKPFLWQNGAAVLDEEKELPTLDDPKALEAFQYVKRLIDAKISIPYDYQKKSDIPFVKGNAAMSFIMASTITNTLKANPQLRDIIGFAPPLEKRKKVPFTGHRLFTIGATSKYKNEAWEFIQFMLSKEQMLLRSRLLDMPIVRKSLEQEYFKDGDAEFKKVVLEYSQLGKSAEVTTVTAISNKYLAEAYQAVYSGKKSPEQALKDAQEGILKDIKK
jgi:ABC-type glycerol-3-phosphate transport system substrate-binding protein